MKIKNAINEMKDSRSCDKKKWFIADKERFVFGKAPNSPSTSLISRLSLLIKLFVVMGVSWLGEALTSMIRFDTDPVLAEIETVWDVFNCLQGRFFNTLIYVHIHIHFLFAGVFIFIIFVCKREIFASLKKKLCTQKLRRTSLSSAFTQSSTLIAKNMSCRH